MSILASGPMILALKGTVLLLLGFAVTRCVRTTGPHLRHRVWNWIFVGLLAVPFLGAALPGWNVLPQEPVAWIQGTDGTAASIPSDPSVDGATPHSSQGVGIPAGETTGTDARGNEASPLNSEGAWGRLPSLSVGWVLVAVWLAGASAVILWMAAGLRALARLRRRSSPLRDPTVRAELEELSRRVGLQPRRVALLISKEATIPVTWGFRRPVLLLPRSIMEGSPEHRRTVLLHELLHIRRGDWALRILVLFACALHWFNPLIWVARGRHLHEQEESVDEGVVAAGVSREEYASLLLELARVLTPRRTPSSMGAAALTPSTTLESRLRTLLGRTGPPTPPPLGTRVATVLVVAAGILAVATAEAHPTHQGRPGPPVEVASEPSLSVGVMEGEPQYELHEVRSPFLLSDGRLAVPLASQHTIRVFGADGTFLEEIGGPGEGPGEISRLSSAWARGDTMEVSDGGLRRIVRFLPDGSSEVVTLDPVPSAESVRPEPLEDGWITMGVAEAGYSERDVWAVHRFGRDGTHLGEVTQVPGMARMEYPSGGGGPHPLSPSARVVIHGGKVYVGETLTPEIRVYDPSGELERTVEFDPAGAPTPEEALQVVRDSALAQDGSRTGIRASLLAPALEIPTPERTSVFWTFLVDGEGYLWVRPYEPAIHAAALGGNVGAGVGAGPGGLWRVFHPDGTELEPIRIPEALEPIRITTDAVIGIHRDEFGVESVRVHPVVRR